MNARRMSRDVVIRRTFLKEKLLHGFEVDQMHDDFW